MSAKAYIGVSESVTGLIKGRLNTLPRIWPKYKSADGWVTKTWDGLTSFRAPYVWSDGTNIYYSFGKSHYILNGDTWEVKTWKELDSFYVGEEKEWNDNEGSIMYFANRCIWSDGVNIYCSDEYHGSYRYDREGDTWETKTWNGLTQVNGGFVWSDGVNIYYCKSTYDGRFSYYVLNGDTWEAKTWKGLTNFNPFYIWSDGENIYYSYDSEQYVLNGDTWEKKTWNGLTSFSGGSVWSDGTNIYYSRADKQYVLNGDTWEATTWNGLTSFSGGSVWSDGTNIYYSNGADHFVLTGQIASKSPAHFVKNLYLGIGPDTGKRLYNGVELPAMPENTNPHACIFGAESASDMLYNGVRLPDIYETWDQGNWDTALLYYDGEGIIKLCIYTFANVYCPSDGTIYANTDGNSNNVHRETWTLSNGEWTDRKNDSVFSTTGMFVIKSPNTVFWTSKDIYYQNGTDLYFATSDPVPAMDCTLCCTDQKVVHDNGIKLPKETKVETYSVSEDGMSWVSSGTITVPAGTVLDVNVIWANYDIYEGESPVTLPISWNTVDVVDNLRVASMDDSGDFIWISDWYAESDDDMWENASILTITAGEESTSISALLITGDGSAYMCMYALGDMQIGVVSIPEDNFEIEGTIFPKRGLYVTDIAAVVGMDVHCEFSGVEKQVYFFDEFPFDMKFGSQSLSALVDPNNNVPMTDSDGNSNGSILKISNLTPSLDELNSTYNTQVSYSVLDGVASEPGSEALTWSWYGGVEGTFVKDNTNYYWVVYEEKTINATVFDNAGCAISGHVTPGVYLSDKAVFALLLTIALLLQKGGEDGDSSNDMMRLCLGTAEDGERVMKEFEELANGGEE